ncbi:MULTISPECIES: helix-turn-helix transcriptional regulator [unclassified Phenylobacterium]|uniref:helix-turn-helix domain-containing protein n=1 Tax=unclassified Phenylobacterium TaxID=2640670 RepID=UPI001F411484|nr:MULTISPECIES: helix-turn-helix transcriptional regulator [unclassified Phenylobacterium]
MTAPRSKNSALSETLKLVRLRRGLKASEVARRMGLPLRTYHHFEGGRAHIDIERIRSFADATDSDAHAILTAVLIGAPDFAAHTMDNKLVSVLISGAQRFDERLGDRLTRIEVARFIAATRRMFDDLEADLSQRDDEARRWLADRFEPGD